MSARLAPTPGTAPGRAAFQIDLALTTRAARDVLGLVNGSSPAAEGADAETRDRAAQSLTGLLRPRAAYGVYLRNGGTGSDNEQVVEIRIASDLDLAPNAALLQALNGKSLVLVGTEKEDRYSGENQFLVFSMRAVPEVWGGRDANSLPAQLTFSVGGAAGQGESGFPMRLLAAITRLPEARAQRETVGRRLADWHRYLGVLERTAKARQFAVSYKAFRRGASTNLLIFTLDPGRTPIPWDKLGAVLDEPLEVRERRGLARTAKGTPEDEDDSDDWLLGVVVGSDQTKNELTIALDEDVEKLLEHRTLSLPRAAALIYKASGDLAQIRRLKFGLELLEQGYGQNPKLAEFIFDARQARQPDPAGPARITLDRSQLLQPRLNEGQRAAVEGALNAPDLFLIQGPPGTGKTTVIAEICYQNALRGQRTLIASQANLAVDHALSRLVHHPSLRALRRGRADRVEVEGAVFLEDRVVGTWLAQTAQHCEADLAARRDRIRKFESLLQNRARVEALAVAIERHQAERPKHAAALGTLEAKLQPLQQHAEQVARALDRRREVADYFSRLRAALESPSAAPDAVPELPAVERLPLHEHAALQLLRDRVADLEAALAAWEPSDEPAGEMAADAAAVVAESPTTLHGLLRAAAAARQRAKTTRARLADQRARLEALAGIALDWYAARDEGERLTREREQLLGQEAALANRRAALESDLAGLQAAADEAAVFDAQKTHAAVPAVLAAWAERFAEAEAGGSLADPPPEFASRLGRDIWAAVVEQAQLYRLGALALEVRTARAEARRLAELGARLSEALAVVQADLAPAAPSGLEASIANLPLDLTPRRARRAALRTASWKHTPLRALAAFDSHGALHPAHDAESTWARLQYQLEELRPRPTGWRARLGGEQARRQALAGWAHALAAAAEDFAHRRADLEAAVRHKSARLHERAAAAAEAAQAAVLDAARTLGPQAAERLAAAQAELDEVVRVQPPVSARLADIEPPLAALADAQAWRENDLQIGRDSLGDARRTRAFQNLLRAVHTGRRAAPDWRTAWDTALASFDKSLADLDESISLVDPLAALAALETDLADDLIRQERNLEQLRQSRRTAEQEAQTARERLRALDERHRQELDWWTSMLAALPERLRGRDDLSPDSPEYVGAMLALSAGWESALREEQAYLDRAEKLVTDWAARLRAGNARDSADLRQIYIDNANVIGITCVQAGAYRFSREYRNFDCVIIDEVSKATPPELLLPMLKGARVVLVGDHKQLPPMIGPESLADLAAELNVPQGELDHIERSLFKELFEAAPTALRVMLTEQYRMHPQIMQAINQFYAEQLAAGLPDPDRQRAHGFDLPWLRPNQHLLWINTPGEGPFVEQRAGTSYYNAGELDVILRLVKELDTAWAPRVAQGEPRKEVGVITFYGAQVRQLKSRLVERSGQFRNLRLRVGTVDRFQGMERAIIICSLVRNNPNGTVGFARKPERVNVAFSRAQELLVIVGSRELFTAQARDSAATAIYRRVAEVVQASGGLRRTNEVSAAYKR